jgi:class 3 adenylate cyclase/pimeloyl-ACP methyl ester carboxylesterase
MQPQIRFCTTADGVRIAYSATGTGPTLLWAPDLPNSHVALEWSQPGIRQQLERLSAEFTLVRFDARGVGLSDRDVPDVSFDARLRDLDAVVAQLSGAPLAVMGVEWSGPLVIAFAARHPERVSHLILLDTFARSADFAGHERNAISMELLTRDWEMFTDSRIALAIGMGKSEAGAYGRFYRECVSQQMAQIMFPELAKDDATHLLRDVRAPALIIQHTEIRTRTVEMARSLAAGIKHSELVIVEGGYFDEILQVVSLVTRFVKGAVARSSGDATSVILFTDIADSTALTTKLGDAMYREKERDLDASLRTAIREAGGTPVEGKLLGDGILSIFASAREAIDAALACKRISDDAELPLHLGIHAGDVLHEGNDVRGGAVQLAARIHDIAAPGEILVSATVRDLARTSAPAGATFEDRGERTLKGIEDPVRVFAVRPSA